MKQSYQEILDVLNEYFDGLYYSDTKRLARVFHPQAHYVCVTDGSLLYRTMGEYFPIVEARPSPASKNESRRDEVVEVSFAGPVTATAKLRCAIGEKFFTDCITLIKVDECWKIISKVFHYDLLKN